MRLRIAGADAQLGRRDVLLRHRARHGCVDTVGIAKHNSHGLAPDRHTMPETPPRMIPRRLLATLVYGLPILVVSFAVIVCGALVAQGLGDATGARGLMWAAIAALLALMIDVVLLVGVLGLMALDPPHDRDEGS